MQSAALIALGLDDWSYEAIEVAPDAFANRVRELPGEGFVGANVTVPHKQAALDSADEASARAREIGAANTLSFKNGRVHAENTDAPGLIAALPEAPAGKRVLVLGAGGAARAVVWGLTKAGALVEIWNRTADRARELADQLGVSTVDSAKALPAAEFDLLVNTTTIGMDGRGGLADLRVEPGSITAEQTIVDLAYGSEPTELIATAQERGAATVDGLEVLVRQGAESLRIWTGLDPPLEVMREAGRGS